MNGRIPAAELTTVQGSMRLTWAAADAWQRMVAACRKEAGVTLRITAPYGAYRDIAAQKAMWKDRSTSTTGKVAVPGFSVHGTGNCVDISNWGSAAGWLQSRAAAFGFKRTIGNEPWHFQFSAPKPSPAPTKRRRKSMSTLFYTTTTDKPSKVGSRQPIADRILAGDGVGSAAWIGAWSADEFASLANVHGSPVFVTKARAVELEKKYRGVK